MFPVESFSDLVSAYKEHGLRYSYREIVRIIKNKFGIPAPHSIFLSPSHQCNANCVHCYEKLPGKKDAFLATAEVQDILRQFRSLGGNLVHFCSGEFLMRKDAIELIEYSRDLKLKVSVATNGLILNKEKVLELKSAGLNELVVSIDSADPKEHDRMRGVKGCFLRAIKGLTYAREAGIKTQIWTYVSRSNYSNLEGVSKLSRTLGVELTFVFFTLLSGVFFNKPEENLTFDEREDFRKRFNDDPSVLLEFPDETDVCRGGCRHHINIMPTGDVTFCPPVPYSYGNVKEKKLKSILRPLKKDYDKFCRKKCTGQCIVNFETYRNECAAKFIG